MRTFSVRVEVRGRGLRGRYSTLRGADVAERRDEKEREKSATVNAWVGEKTQRKTRGRTN